jgi:hypothetical protein
VGDMPEEVVHAWEDVKVVDGITTNIVDVL